MIDEHERKEEKNEMHVCVVEIKLTDVEEGSNMNTGRELATLR